MSTLSRPAHIGRWTASEGPSISRPQRLERRAGPRESGIGLSRLHVSARQLSSEHMEAEPFLCQGRQSHRACRGGRAKLAASQYTSKIETKVWETESPDSSWPTRPYTWRRWKTGGAARLRRQAGARQHAKSTARQGRTAKAFGPARPALLGPSGQRSTHERPLRQVKSWQGRRQESDKPEGSARAQERESSLNLLVCEKAGWKTLQQERAPEPHGNQALRRG